MVRVALAAAALALLAGACALINDATETGTSQTVVTPLPQQSDSSSADSGTPATDLPDDEAPATATVAPVEWQPCEGGADCATVTVPIDHANPGGGGLDVALVRIAATGPADQVRGSIFINPGGPGGSGVDQVLGGFRFEPDVMARYHLIGFDPRGVARSNPLSCGWDRAEGPLVDHSPDTEAEVAALDTASAALADQCADTDGDLLPHLTTENVARDLDLLRQAVGDDRLHYYGFSYGTLLGLIYADLFPERIGHLGLDAVVDPTQGVEDLLRQQAAAFEQSFLIMDAACDIEFACPPGGLAATHDRLVARLEAEGPIGEVGQTEAEVAALFAQYGRWAWPIYADALLAADRDGDVGGLERLNDVFVSSLAFAEYVAVVCVDSPRPGNPEAWEAFARDLAADNPRFGAVVANEVRSCAHWPVDPQPRRDPVTAPGSAPILVIGNTNDAATPLENAITVAETLESAALVILDTDGHAAYSDSACVRAIVTEYFVNDEVPAETARC